MSSEDSQASSITKLFVGNLLFKTTVEDLATVFGKYGTVVSANIITRGPRSLGYGFVEMSSLSEAEAAVQAIDQQLLDGRKINVEIAKLRESNDTSSSSSSSSSSSPSTFSTSNTHSGTQRYRGRGGRIQTDSSHQEGDRPRFQRSTNNYGTRPRTTKSDQSDSTSSTSSPSARSTGRPRYTSNSDQQQQQDQRAPRDQKPRVESENTLFVANLPFTVDDAGLAAIFDGFNVVKAHVVRHNSRSKGFGFVEFASHADQLAALQAKERISIDQRELTIKVALTPDTSATASDATTETTSDATPPTATASSDTTTTTTTEVAK